MASKMAASLSTRGQAFDALYPGTAQKVSMSVSHAESTAVGANTTVVQLCSDADCFIRIGSAPVATSDGTSTFLPAKIPRLFACNGGDKVSGIVGSSTGNLFITEGA